MSREGGHRLVAKPGTIIDVDAFQQGTAPGDGKHSRVSKLSAVRECDVLEETTPLADRNQGRVRDP